MSSLNYELSEKFVEIEGLRLHYREAGEGDAVLFLHGWPTSSFLWRRVMEPIAIDHRAIALDLPGFGLSAKPLDVSYSFRFFDRIISGFLDSLKIETTSLVVHDLGGPVGLYWASQHRERLANLALLNTLVYPEMSWAVVLFVAALKLPGIRAVMTSPWGLRKALEFGVADRQRLTLEALTNISAPFASRQDRLALLAAGQNLSPKGFAEIASWLPSLDAPVRAIYGVRDRILPDIARTMARLQNDVPQAQITPLQDCGHFLQEERPEKIGGLLATFLVGDS